MLRSKKAMFAGVFAACVFGGIALRFAWATPGASVFSTLLAGPAALEELDIKIDDNPTHSLKLKTKGQWEIRVVHFRVAPGGFFGWHSHPGPVFVMVEAGTLSFYEGTDPTPSATYPAGTGFVDQGGGHVHDARNDGTTDVEIVAMFLIPLGESLRIDEPAPE